MSIISGLNDMRNNHQVAMEHGVAKVITFGGSINDHTDMENQACIIANRQRASGESKRKHIERGNTFHFFNCACGKNSGKRYTDKSFHMWKRLHKKVCPFAG